MVVAGRFDSSRCPFALFQPGPIQLQVHEKSVRCSPVASHGLVPSAPTVAPAAAVNSLAVSAGCRWLV
jgi:hypothetical protein